MSGNWSLRASGRGSARAPFARAYVTVTPDYEVHVSARLREDWENGHRYYPFDRQKLLVLPGEEARPSPEALEWQRERVFLG